MRGGDNRTGELFSYVDLEARVRRDHPVRAIRTIVNEALSALEREFAGLYSPIGRPSIPPEKLLRAMLLQAFYSIRSERLLMERLEYDLLFRWFVGIGVDDAVWDHSMQSVAVNTAPKQLKPFRPGQSVTAAQKSALRHLTRKLFKGSAELLFVHLVSDQRLSEKQILNMRKLLESRSDTGEA